MLSADACDLISRLLAKDPNRRISIDKVRKPNSTAHATRVGSRPTSASVSVGPHGGVVCSIHPGADAPLDPGGWHGANLFRDEQCPQWHHKDDADEPAAQGLRATSGTPPNTCTSNTILRFCCLGSRGGSLHQLLCQPADASAAHRSMSVPLPCYGMAVWVFSPLCRHAHAAAPFMTCAMLHVWGFRHGC